MSLSSAAAAALDAVHKDDFDDAGSQAASSRDSKAPSVSDWEGDESVPEYATISTENCRCIFKFKQVPHTLVCGNLSTECRR